MNYESDDIIKTLKKHGIDIKRDRDSLFNCLISSTSTYRDEAMRTFSPNTAFLEGDFWNIPPKYKIDIIVQDILYIVFSISKNIAISLIKSNEISNMIKQYDRSLDDVLFWDSIEHSLRLISSGWDRIGLLIDLVYNLNLNTRCNFPNVINILPKLDITIFDNEYYKKLKQFRDTYFIDLENKRGKGYRHETTHLISLPTRIFFEFLEGKSNINPSIKIKDRPAFFIEFVTKHYEYYIEGTKNTCKLIESFNITITESSYLRKICNNILRYVNKLRKSLKKYY